MIGKRQDRLRSTNSIHFDLIIVQGLDKINKSLLVPSMHDIHDETRHISVMQFHEIIPQFLDGNSVCVFSALYV